MLLKDAVGLDLLRGAGDALADDHELNACGHIRVGHDTDLSAVDGAADSVYYRSFARLVDADDLIRELELNGRGLADEDDSLRLGHVLVGHKRARVENVLHDIRLGGGRGYGAHEAGAGGELRKAVLVHVGDDDLVCLALEHGGGGLDHKLRSVVSLVDSSVEALIVGNRHLLNGIAELGECAEAGIRRLGSVVILKGQVVDTVHLD